MNNIIQPYFWNRFMILEELKHFDENGKCIWECKNIPNIWHNEGQDFALSVAFDTDGGFEVPTNYYLGLDDRSTLALTDEITSLEGEPSSGGYSRQAVSSTTGFSVGLTGDVVKATSGIVSFSATTATWGPVKNLFLVTTVDDTGFLIASVALPAERTVVTGQSLTARMSLSLSPC